MKKYFEKPKISTLVETELYEATRHLLQLEAATEQYAAMLDMQRQRVERLKRLAASL